MCIRDRWSPFHINKISYWARTTMVPLMVLAALKPLARNPKGIGIDELFLQDPKTVGMNKKAPHQSLAWYALFSSLMLLLPKFIAGYSGVFVDAYGYAAFFNCTALLGVPVLVLVALAARALPPATAPRE